MNYTNKTVFEKHFYSIPTKNLLEYKFVNTRFLFSYIFVDFINDAK